MQNVYGSKLSFYIYQKEKDSSSFIILLAKKLSDNMNKVFMPNVSYKISRTLVKKKKKKYKISISTFKILMIFHFFISQTELTKS